MKQTRRDFLATSSGVCLALVCPSTACSDEGYGGFRMGAQSSSFRPFDTVGALDILGQLGLESMEFCNAHFLPALDSPKCQEAKKLIAQRKVKTPSFGVEAFPNDEKACRVKFDFAKAFGMEMLVADPDPNAFDLLDKLTVEYKIKIAIHNHGPKTRYGKTVDTMSAIKDHSEMIGVCVDTGHAIRSGEKPHEVIEAFGSRVYGVHLKDWVYGGETKIIGEGDMDLVEVAKALKKIKFDGPLMLEYELDRERPIPGMSQSLENWKMAIASI